MSPLRTASRGTATSVPGDLDRRLAGLRRAVEACDAHLDAAHVPPLAHAHAVLTRAGERLGLGAGLTVAALAGATGSGKSSTFNALAGAEVSTVGVRRPTTSATSAALWCPEAVAAPLLDWLAVPSRHVVLPGADGGEGSSDPLHGLVLLDLPDHDSTQATHRAEVDRVVGLADVLVWVLDPQKYADALVHEEYLQPWAGHGVVTVVALNQVDRVGADDLEPVLADLRRLLDDDGLREAELLAVSARTGEGLADLRALLAQRVTSTRAAQVRLAADVARSATA
ncbi:MAG TPA: GTPase, partial [Dermatophilaceae bacterium]|nr:GTPase [Dermatophilaceae bacterium]